MFQIKWLFRNMGKRYRVACLAALVLAAAASSTLIINPYLTSMLIDNVIIGKNTESLLPLLAIMMAVQLGRLGLRYLMNILLEFSSQNALFNIRRHLFRVLQFQEGSFFDNHRTGDLMTRFTGDLDWCRHFIAYISYAVTECAVMFVSVLIFLFVINWKLTLALAAVTPLLTIITKMYSKKVFPLFRRMRDRLSDLNTATQENIAGNRVVKAFAREDYEKEKFDKCNTAFREANRDINKLWLSFFPIIEFIAGSMTIITIFVGGIFIINGSLTPGDLAIFTSLTWALSNPMRSLGTLLNDMQRFVTSSSKVIEVYYARPLIVDRAEAEDHDIVRGHIEFRNVSFSYSRSKVIPVLHDISFTVQPGQTLAIMGATGCGKTTIINLLVRLYDVTGGQVLVDGCDVRDWKTKQLRRGVGVATQDVFLFSDTVEGNIVFGNQELSEEQAHDFARRAAADGFINKMPGGYDTIVGERGVGLSGGQKQRIALARALAVCPSILVLDDTTSAIDLETEKYLQQQIRSLPFTCTKVMIAQRTSSVMHADHIIVLQDGRIAEQGTHSQLLAERGYYWETYALQNDIPLDAPVSAGAGEGCGSCEE